VAAVELYALLNDAERLKVRTIKYCICDVMDSLFLYYFIFLFFFIFLQSTHAAFKRAKLATATASAEQKANTASPAARRASATKRARRKIPLKLLSSGGGGGTSFHKLQMKV
jgi:hypothetical protein